VVSIARAAAGADAARVGTDTFRGYGLFGQAFDSGDVIAFHRVEWSSIGPPFASAWHRRPTGEWVFHTNVAPLRSWSRYFGSAAHEVVSGDIDIAWAGRHEVSLHVRAARLRLALRLEATPATRVIGLLAGLVPDPVWHTRRGTAWLGAVAGRALEAGTVTLAGDAPSGHRFHLRPRAVWRVVAAAAVLDGRELGAPAPAAADVDLAGMRIPRVGLLATGDVVFAR
jgi:hypothetical protein